jgi:transcriptional regulator with XRE-family HTH domain
VARKKTSKNPPVRASATARTALGAIVRTARLDRGLSAAELAKAAGLPVSDIARVEAGGGPKYPADQLERLASALRLTAIQRRELLSSSGCLPTALERAMLKNPTRWREVDELLRRPEPKTKRKAKWGAKHSFVMSQPHWMSGRDIQAAAAKEGLIMSIPYIYNIRSKARRLVEDASQKTLRRKVTGQNKQKLIQQFKDVAFVLGVPHSQKLLDEITQTIRRSA